MSALGHNVWMVRWLAFVLAGFWGGVSGVLYVYYNTYISPHALSLTHSAEVLLMVIAGGPATLMGPVVGAALVILMKNVASAYVERWTMLLGAVFVVIVVFLPDGLVPGVRRLHQRWFGGRR
jgi:branched-chain amino acid transport system permease protein